MVVVATIVGGCGGGVFVIVALGDIYGDCNAETNADEGGETSGDS